MAELKDKNDFDPQNGKALSDNDIPESAKGKWIAIEKGDIIATENSEMEVYKVADAKADSENFLITKIPEDSKARVL